jgi:hypothetical protein
VWSTSFKFFVYVYVCQKLTDLTKSITMLCLGRVITMAIPKRNHKLEQNQLFILFPYTWLNNLKSFGRIKFVCRLECLFRRPLGSAARGGGITPAPHLHLWVGPHLLLGIVWTTSTYLWCILRFFPRGLCAYRLFRTALCWSTCAVNITPYFS